jgi:hypothetical protein
MEQKEPSKAQAHPNLRRDFIIDALLNTKK